MKSKTEPEATIGPEVIKDVVDEQYDNIDVNSGISLEDIKTEVDEAMERIVSKNGDSSITHFELINNFEIKDQKLSLVKFKLETGRTHQIRVHSKHIGHSILGDSLYGKTSFLINRQALHAYKISFIHPISKETLVFKANIPNDIKQVIDFNIDNI